MKIPILVASKTLTPELVELMEKHSIGIELSFFAFPATLQNKNLQKKVKEYKNMLKNFTLPVTMHGAFYDLSVMARDPMIVDVTRFRYNQSIEIAIELGLNKIVFHPNYSHSNRAGYKEFWINKQVRFWKQFIAKIEANNLVIHLENTREEDYTYISAIIERLNHNCFKTCYDTGHSHCFTHAKNKPVHWVENYGKHLTYIHLHSNHGFVDDHIAFTEGSVDFSGFFEALKQLPKPPYLVIEVARKEDFEISLQKLREIGF